MKWQDILKNELDSLAKELQAKHEALGMKASGRWVNSLRVEITETGGELWAEDYTKYLVEGRPKGKFPPFDGEKFAEIENWIKAKGISFEKDDGIEMEIGTVAFLIARKIKEKGTDYYIKGGTDLIDGVITEERIKKISDAMGIGIFVDIEELITNKMNYA